MDDVRELLQREALRISAAPDAIESTFARTRKHQRSRRIAAIAVALVLAGALGAVLWGGLRGLGRENPATGVIDPRRVVSVTEGEGWIWVSTCTRCSDQDVTSAKARGVLFRIDPRTGRTASHTVVDNPGPMVTGFGSLWVANGWAGTVTRIDVTGRAVASIRLLPNHQPSFVEDVAVGPTEVWADTTWGAAVRIDPATDKVSDVVRVPPEQTGPLAVSGSSIWVTEDVEGVIRYDARTGSLSRIHIGTDLRRLSAMDIAVGQGVVVVAGRWSDGTISNVGGKQTIQYGPAGQAAVAWIDIATNAVLGTTTIPDWSGSIASISGHVWVSRAGGTILAEVDPAAGLGASRSVGPSVFLSSEGVFIIRDGTVQAVRLPAP